MEGLPTQQGKRNPADAGVEEYAPLTISPKGLKSKDPGKGQASQVNYPSYLQTAQQQPLAAPAV